MADEGSSPVGKQIQQRIKAAMDLAQEQQKRDMFKRRLEVAKKGIMSLEEGKALEAVYHFRTYLRIVEDGKGVADHGLSPQHFNKETDLQEMLLITGVYWDLAKIYDRSNGPEADKDFRIFLNKFVVFSQGMPYQPVSAETLRKTVSYSRVKHRKEFRAAYVQLTGNKCFVSGALIDLIPENEISRLRALRTDLLQTGSGRLFVASYNRVGPWMARGILHAPDWFRALCARLVRGLVQNRPDA